MTDIEEPIFSSHIEYVCGYWEDLETLDAEFCKYHDDLAAAEEMESVLDKCFEDNVAHSRL